MTCVNCGSTAIQPNGWCGACGQPATPPVAAAPESAWPPAQAAPPQQPSWATPQQNWSTAQQGEWPQPQQNTWAQPATHQNEWSQAAPQQNEWSASQQGGWAAPSQNQGDALGQPAWATDATSTFGVPAQPTYEAPAGAYQAPGTSAGAYQTPPVYQPQAVVDAYQQTSAPPAPAYQAPPAYQPPPSGQTAPPVMDATVVGGFPAYPQPQPAAQPYASGPPPYMVSNQPAAAPKAGNPFSIVAFVLAGVSLLLFPIFAGPLAIVFGAVALYRRERLGRLALTLALVGLIAGVGLSMLVNSFL
ncbi:hypothetical protein OWR29_31430 [Actinoplanes sp. Pm04-4]|uniref:DUF4190 domain-containing protein n=1 Tax=Paractinoplanes pyxinae TaxID=2997416 RepID=A0ABT4B7P6_9ACTN|nr:hypothetical protein [Actinoplanes pyxinae]MCY1142532.1 hypothetical protein [Actinoplanes pyxinae]